jgi:hypothetical protein
MYLCTLFLSVLEKCHFSFWTDHLFAFYLFLQTVDTAWQLYTSIAALLVLLLKILINFSIIRWPHTRQLLASFFASRYPSSAFSRFHQQLVLWTLKYEHTCVKSINVWVWVYVDVVKGERHSRRWVRFHRRGACRSGRICLSPARSGPRLLGRAFSSDLTHRGCTEEHFVFIFLLLFD